MKRLGQEARRMLLGFLACICINCIFQLEPLANWYTRTLYPVLASALSKVTTLIPFALGELGIYAGIVLVFGILLQLFGLVFLRGNKDYVNHFANYMKHILRILLVMLVLYTFCWMIPYHNTLLGIPNGTSHSLEELQNLREQVVLELNQLSGEVSREENGDVLYPEDVEQKATFAMQSLGQEFPLLQGFYPRIKVALCTDVLDWMGIGGYTYPFTMEVTRNRYLSKLYYPTLYTHEMAHHKGFYKESEANFISFLACARSDDFTLRYSAYYSIYSYLNDAYISQLYVNFSKDEAKQIYNEQVRVSEQVRIDVAKANQEVEELYEQNANHDLEVFKESAEEVADVGWSTQKDLLKEANYDGVVGLLLEYYKNNKMP